MAFYCSCIQKQYHYIPDHKASTSQENLNRLTAWMDSILGFKQMAQHYTKLLNEYENCLKSKLSQPSCNIIVLGMGAYAIEWLVISQLCKQWHIKPNGIKFFFFDLSDSFLERLMNGLNTQHCPFQVEVYQLDMSATDTVVAALKGQQGDLFLCRQFNAQRAIDDMIAIGRRTIPSIMAPNSIQFWTFCQDSDYMYALPFILDSDTNSPPVFAEKYSPALKLNGSELKHYEEFKEFYPDQYQLCLTNYQPTVRALNEPLHHLEYTIVPGKTDNPCNIGSLIQFIIQDKQEHVLPLIKLLIDSGVDVNYTHNYAALNYLLTTYSVGEQENLPLYELFITNPHFAINQSIAHPTFNTNMPPLFMVFFISIIPRYEMIQEDIDCHDPDDISYLTNAYQVVRIIMQRHDWDPCATNAADCTILEALFAEKAFSALEDLLRLFVKQFGNEDKYKAFIAGFKTYCLLANLENDIRFYTRWLRLLDSMSIVDNRPIPNLKYKSSNNNHSAKPSNSHMDTDDDHVEYEGSRFNVATMHTFG